MQLAFAVELFLIIFSAICWLFYSSVEKLVVVQMIDTSEVIDYVTREFVRTDCGIHGARLSDEDCDIIIAEVVRLAEQGRFHHTGVYWIANRLAAEGMIHPIMPH